MPIAGAAAAVPHSVAERHVAMRKAWRIIVAWLAGLAPADVAIVARLVAARPGRRNIG